MSDFLDRLDDDVEYYGLTLPEASAYCARLGVYLTHRSRFHRMRQRYYRRRELRARWFMQSWLLGAALWQAAWNLVLMVAAVIG